MVNRVFEQSIVIREEHLDTFGHVNNARYLEIFEQARWDFITDNGFGLDYIEQPLAWDDLLQHAGGP